MNISGPNRAAGEEEQTAFFLKTKCTLALPFIVKSACISSGISRGGLFCDAIYIHTYTYTYIYIAFRYAYAACEVCDVRVCGMRDRCWGTRMRRMRRAYAALPAACGVWGVRMPHGVWGVRMRRYLRRQQHLAQDACAHWSSPHATPYIYKHVCVCVCVCVVCVYIYII